MSLNTRIRGAQIVLIAGAIDITADELAFIDSDGVMKRESVDDLVTAQAGDGMQNVSSQFAVDVSDFAGEGVEDDGSENLRVKLDGTTLARSGSGIKVNANGLDDTELNAGAGSVGDVLTLGTGTTLEWTTPTADTDEKVKAKSGDTAGYLEDVVTDLTGAVVDVSADSIMFLDGDTKAKLESIADLATAMAGSGITATNGVLSADAVADNIVEADIKAENLSADVDVTGYDGTHTLTNIPVTSSVQIFLNGLLQEEGSGKDYTLGGTGNKTVTFATQPVSGDIIIAHYILND